MFWQGHTKINEREDSASQPVLEVLQRLWQTKVKSIELLERWLHETDDAEISAGLSNQLVDERRHLRLIGEQIRALGGRIASAVQRDALARAFHEAQTAGTDLTRMFAFHRGIKAYTVERCAHILPLVDAGLASVLERIARDDERHIRWADLRLARLLTYDKMRECNLLLGRMRTTLESIWGRSRLHVTAVLSRRRSA